MPRKKSWKISNAKKGASHPKKKNGSKEGEPVLHNNRKTNKEGEPVLHNNRKTNKEGEPVLHKNRKTNNALHGKTNELSYDALHGKTNELSNDALHGKTHELSDDTYYEKANDKYLNDLLQKDTYYESLHNGHIDDEICCPKGSPYVNNCEGDLNDKSLNTKPYNAFYTRFGNFNQSDAKFEFESRGNQCTCNALVFLVMSNYVDNPKLIDPDTVLISGDQIYRKTVTELKEKGNFKEMLFNFEEIPTVVEITEGKFQIGKNDIYFGSALQTNASSDFASLQEALAKSFDLTKYVLIMIGKICSAVYFNEGKYFFFDSHSHGHSTLFDEFGTSIIIGFIEINDLINYLYALYSSMFIDLTGQFEILPVSVLNMNSAAVATRHMKNYFAYQKQQKQVHSIEVKLAETTKPLQKSRTEYNREYKQKQRKSLIFKLRERRRESVVRKTTRQDPLFRYKERHQESISKKAARQDSSFRDKERHRDSVARISARKDSSFRDKERHSDSVARKSARKDSLFRDKERHQESVSKKAARQDSLFRDKERHQESVSKKAARQDSSFRDKERQKDSVARKAARQNTLFRSKERVTEVSSKRGSRKYETYKKKEANTKRKARQNPMYRDIERKIELLAKQKARYSEQQKCKERQFKRKAREDEAYLQIETKRDMIRKRQKRLIEENLEIERLSKQNSRRKNQSNVRKYNRVMKQVKRKDNIYLKHENLMKKQSLYGSSFTDCIRKFEEKMSVGPIYICSSCHQTWFSDSVVNAKSLRSSEKPIVSTSLTNFKSVDNIEWICHTCQNAIRANKIPRLSVANKMGFPEKPKALDLYPLEERLVSLRIPFMQIRQLPRGGQLSVKGNVVNVPVDVQPTIHSLPRNIDQSGTIAVKLKKKLAFKTCDFSENIRPLAVICALHYLMKRSELYKSSGIQIDEQWIKKVENLSLDDEEMTSNDQNINQSDNDSDHFSEVDERELHVGNTDTLLDRISEELDPKNDHEYIFAPGEGQRPLSLYYDEDAEYLSFPTIFCGQRRSENKERSVKVHYSDIVKWELRSVDRRVAQSVPNLFFKLKKIQLKNISDKVHLALRRCKSDGKQWQAKDVLNPSTVNQLVRLDEGYYIFRTLRNSPVYLEKKKKDLFAMIRQLGLPKWFGSFSSADTRWLELLRVLGKLNDNKDYTDTEIKNMNWQDKTRLVQKDPVTCSRFFDYRVQQFIKVVLKNDLNPIGKVTDYFYRVEFQQRGSPHIHILIWIENAPTYNQDSNEDIVAYIDKYVSCSSIPDQKELIDLQVHKHAKTCRKKGHPICRFGFPLPPFKKTTILEPLETGQEKYKCLYQEVQKKIDSLSQIEDVENITFEQFLSDILAMTEEEYVKVIRSNLNGPKVFLERRPSEVRINPYMKIVLSAWKANHDLQFVLDPYACAMYIVSYISKSQKGMSALLDQAAKEARQGNLDLKRQVRHIGNYFTNSVETCAQEAIYLLLQLPLTKATRQVVFINTSSSDKRTFLLKTTSALEKMSPDSTDIEAENDIKRYSKRPKALENWCLADYISKLEITYPKKTSEENENYTEDLSDNEMEEEEQEGNDAETNTFNLELKNGVTIKQRKSFKVIRYVRFNKKNDSENFYRERLMLFHPWRCETDLKGQHASYEEMYHTVNTSLELKVKLYEHNAEELDRAQEQAENDSSQFDEIAPNTQQTELETIEEETINAPQYVHFNPECSANQKNYDISEELGMSHAAVELSSHAKRLNNDDYFELLRCLNIGQREFFLHVISWIKTKEEPLYAFLTGGAGVGKSVVVKAIFQSLHRFLCAAEGEDPDNIRILLCAPTGKAAYNINGVTIHNGFQIQPSKGFNQSLSCDVLNTLRTKYRDLSVIMIDEISMVGNRMFGLLDTRLQKIKGSNKPFGGVSLIAIGDFYQLKPVFDGWIFDDQSKGIAALAPNLWKELFTFHDLTEIMRQKDDIDFAQLLNRLREDELSQTDIDLLNTRVIRTNDPNYPWTTTHLFRENALVDSFNLQYIAKLTTPKVQVPSVDTINADVSEAIKKKLVNSLPKNQSDTANLAKEVQLAVGMKYDLTANINVEDGLTNGSSCEVKFIEYKTNTPRPSIVWVQFTEEKIGSNTRMKYHHLYTKDVKKSWTPVFDIKRSFVYKFKTFDRIQFPLRPSAAKTIHKSQGDTLDTVVVNLSAKSKATVPHIHYVALSRVRSLNGLHIVDLNLHKVSVSNSVREELQRLRSNCKLNLCFTPLYTMDTNLFKVVFNNTRSLHAHIKDVKSDPNILNADVIGLAETRLVSSDQDELYMLEGYNLIRNDQNQINTTLRPPHGLALYVKNTNQLLEVNKYTSTDLEFVVSSIVNFKGHVQVVVVYKSPQCKLQRFKEVCISELLPLLNVQMSNLIIMGDFNYDILKGNTSFLQFMTEIFACTQTVQKDTTNYNTCLDLIFTNIDPEVQVKYDVLEAYWSDHKVVYAAIKLS